MMARSCQARSRLRASGNNARLINICVGSDTYDIGVNGCVGGGDSAPQELAPYMRSGVTPLSSSCALATNIRHARLGGRLVFSRNGFFFAASSGDDGWRIGGVRG